MLIEFLQEKVSEFLAQQTDNNVLVKTQAQVQVTKPEFEGDLTVVVFPLAKVLRKSPEETAKLLGDFLIQQSPLFEKYNVIKGFVNVSVSNAYWMEFIAKNYTDEQFGIAKKNSGKTYIVEYSSPNTNKPLHLGHLRNNFIGYSVSEILKANGHHVHKVQIINDRGIHICKSMLAWKKSGLNETPESTGLKGDKLVGKYYVEFEKTLMSWVRNEITQLFNNPKETPDQNGNILIEYIAPNYFHDEKEIMKVGEILDDYAPNAKNPKLGKPEDDKELIEIFKPHAPILAEAQEMLRKWEAGDKETVDLWKKMNGWVYDGFNATYKKLKVDFDKLYYESDTYILGKDIVEDGLKRGVFFKKEDGSVWIDLTADGLDQKLLLRSDGTSVYITQDVGTAVLRFKDYPEVNGMIYTVGNEQDYHFKVLFLILKKLGYAWANECYHLSYGMVDLPTGKMKSREGTVVDADDLVQEMVEEAEKITKELGKADTLNEDEKLKLYDTLALGALKYYILKVDPKKRMLFNPAESIDFQGNTGPFIQYAFARINSLLQKGGVNSVNINLQTPVTEHELTLIKQLHQFPTAVKQAGEEYSPAAVANYIYEVVKSFNHFYQNVSVLKEENQDLRNLRIALCINTGTVIKNGLKLLGIEVPARM